MGKHYDLSKEKQLFLLELWHRERGREIDWVKTFSAEEAAQYEKENGM